MIRHALLAASLLAGTAAHAAAQDQIGALSAQELLALAKATYKGDTCWWDRVEADIDQVQSWELSFRYEFEKEDGPDRLARLYQMPCNYGAYNFGSIFFIETEFDGLLPLHFAEPVLDIDYADDNSEVVRSVTVAGFTATYSLVNALFDEETRTINSFSKWRGIGDASSSGSWAFRDGGFMLTGFAVDASYDGEITPETVYSAPGG